MQLKQDYAKGHSRMATALMAMKMYREAQQSYQTALHIEPGNEAIMNQLRAVEAKMALVEQQGALPVATPASQAPNSVGQVTAVPVRRGRNDARTTGMKRDGQPDDDGGDKRQVPNSLSAVQRPKTRVEELQQAGNAAFRAGEPARA